MLLRLCQWTKKERKIWEDSGKIDLNGEDIGKKIKNNAINCYNMYGMVARDLQYTQYFTGNQRVEEIMKSYVHNFKRLKTLEI